MNPFDMFARRWLPICLLLLLLGAGSLFAAQDGPAEDGWSGPLNLSKSGAASAPQVVALAGDYLVFWEDAFEGFVFSRGRDANWTEPASEEFPFATRAFFPELRAEAATPRFRPKLVTGAGNRIHAFWRDGEGALYTSNVDAGDFGDFAAWSQRQQVAQAAGALDVVVDREGALHVAYVRPASADGIPAGLYARRSSDGGATWESAEALYTSAYFRGLGPEAARVALAVAGGELYLAWEDPALERVYFSRSADGGASWREPQLIDQRGERDSQTAVGPRQVELVALGDAVHLLWQAGHEGRTCAYIHQWSGDGGASWSEATAILEGVARCGEGDEMAGAVWLAATETTALLATAGPTGATLSLWTGLGWSEPARQGVLAGFTNEATLRPVTLDCGRDLAVYRGTLAVAGCGDGDIWWLARDLEPLVGALNVTPVWSTPAPLGASFGDEDAGMAGEPAMVADAEGVFHAFWSQHDTLPAGAPFAGLPGAIYYARFDGASWSRPVAIVEAEDGRAEAPAVASLPNGRLLLLWSGGNSGEIRFNWAAAARASVASEWTAPQPLPAPRAAGSAPDVVVGRDGVIYAVYALPLNEGRGIYLTTSTNQGESWGAAELVFDGAAAGVDSVDRPRLALTGLDGLHVVWEQGGLPGAPPAGTLAYSRSGDGGATWSAPEAVENGTLQRGPVVWSEVVGVGEQVVHRAWQEWDGTRRNLWHQVSVDAGATWSRAGLVGGLGMESGPAALMVDPAEQVYVVQLAGMQEGTGARANVGGFEGLLVWQWVAAEERWMELEGLALGGEGAVVGVGAAVDRQGRLAALVTGQDGAAVPLLLAAEREVALPETLPTPLPTLTPTPPPTPQPTVTPLPLPTSTPVFPTGAGGQSPLPSLPIPGGDLVGAALLGLIPALLVVLAAVVVYLRVRPR